MLLFGLPILQIYFQIFDFDLTFLTVLHTFQFNAVESFRDVILRYLYIIRRAAHFPKLNPIAVGVVGLVGVRATSYTRQPLDKHKISGKFCSVYGGPPKAKQQQQQQQ